MKLSYRNEKNAKFISSYYGKPLDKPDWYIVNTASEDEADILIYDFIGWPFNEARDFIAILSGMKQSKITIRINSPGGDVFDANAIHNAIKDHPSKPVTRIESLAASAASYIAVAGFKKQAYKNAMVMIHEPMTCMFGNQYELRETADVLEQISGAMIDMYADNTNIGKREIKELLKAETWLTAKTAKDKGFVDEIVDAGKGAKANFDLSIFANLPTELKAELKPEDKPEPDIRSIEKLLREVGGLSKNKAKALLARGWHTEATDDNDPETKKPESHSEEIRWDAGTMARLTKNIELLSKGI